MDGKKIAIVLPSPAFRPVGGNKIIYEYVNRISKDVDIKFDLFYDNNLAQKTGVFKKYSKYFISKIYPFWNWFEFDGHNNINHISKINLGRKDLETYDMIIATTAESARNIYKMNLRKKVLYFIQGYENWTLTEEQLHETYRYKDFINIVVSKWLYKKVTIYSNKKVIYLPNSIDITKYYNLKPFEQRYIYSICLMYHELKLKGSSEGIEALKFVNKVIPELKVRMFGKFKKPKNLPNFIEYYEKPSQKELLNIYNSSSLFLSSSYSEGFGLTPAEAMMCGCCVISTRSGGVEDFCIDNKTALLIPSPPNPQEIKNTIIKIFSDYEHMKKLAKEGEKYIKLFNWDENLCVFKNLIYESIKE